MHSNQNPGGEPKVSFIIAAYNEEDFIEECIESCLSQTYRNIELCITDDGSTDRTPDILALYQHDPRVKVRRFEENRGKVAAFNSSFELASGDFIAIMGADDIACPDRVEVSLRSIGNYPLICGDLTTFKDGKTLSNSLMTDHYGIQEDQDLFFDRLLRDPCVFGGTILAKRQVFKIVFPIDERMSHEDWWIPLICATHSPVRYIARVLLNYRQHPGNVTSAFVSRRLPRYQTWRAVQTRDVFFWQKVLDNFNLSASQDKFCRRKLAWLELLLRESVWGRLRNWWTIARYDSMRKAIAGGLCAIHPRVYYSALSLYTRITR